MVDFNSEGTISKPPKEIVALIILEKHYNFLEADEHYAKTRLQGAGIGTEVCRARLRSLFLICYSMLHRRLKKDKFEDVKNVCCDLKAKVEPADIMNCFITIHTVLDELQLLKLDTKPVYKRHHTEEANKQHGYG